MRKYTDEELKKLPERQQQFIRSNRKRWKEHKEELSKSGKKSYYKYREKRLPKQREYYRETKEQHSLYMKKYRLEHFDIIERYENTPERRNYIIIKHKEYKKKIKEDCLDHYSGGKAKCSICGIDNILVLTIDHINGGGRKESRDQCRGRQGVRMYRYLQQNNYPSGYRVLCFNCNFIEAHNKGFFDTSIIRKENRKRGMVPHP